MYAHEGIKNYQCDKCDKTFRTLNDLKRHSITHTGEKPFSCKVCNKDFNRRGNCLKHERTHNKYKCEICSDTFRLKSQLKKHLKHDSHTKMDSNGIEKNQSQSEIPTVSIQNDGGTYIMYIDDVAWNVEVENGEELSQENNSESGPNLWDNNFLKITDNEDDGDNLYVTVVPIEGMNINPGDPEFSIVESDANLSLPIPLIFNNETFQIPAYFVNENFTNRSNI